MRNSFRLSLAAGMADGLCVAGSGLSSAAVVDTLYIPQDIQSSDTRETGHFEVQGSGLHIWTEDNTSTDKVALYFDAGSVQLDEIGEPSLAYTDDPSEPGATPPGFQLVVDFDGDGEPDGILVGEDIYGGDWWASPGSETFVKEGAPNNGGGFGSTWYGTLDEWRTAFPDAVVESFGFSLGSGVKGDGVIESITFNSTEYTFAESVTLGGKNDCKDGGWATSTPREFRNQGDCVSYFASNK